MSWQERIESYKQEEEQGKQEEVNRRRQERLENCREKIPPLLETLKRFNCEELLTSIRDEVWKLGDISIEPDLDNITEDDSPEQARVVLKARWPYYVPGCFRSGGYSPDTWEPAGIGTHTEFLSINAIYGPKEDITLAVDSKEPRRDRDDTRGWGKETLSAWSSFYARNERAAILLENALIRDCIHREERGWPEHHHVPYDQAKKKDEQEIIDKIRAGELSSTDVPKKFDYLLDLAKKAQQETAGTQPGVSPEGFLGKLFRKR